MANGIRKTQDEFVSEINKINPDIEVLGEYVNAFTKIKCKCKLCGTIFDIVPANILHRNNISCPTCSDGISYPNKFVRNVLRKLPLQNLTYEYKIDENNQYSYDDYFIYNSQEYVIEVDGAQHYEDGKFWNDTSEEQQNRDKEKDELAKRNNIIVIRIDARKSDPLYLKDSIINSDLSSIVDLSNINWEECHIKSLNSLVKEVCDLYNDGYRNIDIVRETKLGRHTVTKYLKIGNELGWCKYINQLSKEIKVYDKNDMTERYSFNSLSECADKLTDMLKEEFNKKMIVNVCCGHKKSYKGFVFKYVA